MSGRRRRALRAAFAREHGRRPYRAQFRGGVLVQQDELRRAKKDYGRRHR